MAKPAALHELADAAVADARSAVMRGHRTVGTGRIHVSVEKSTIELGLAQWKAKDTATLGEAEVVELIERLTTGLSRLRASLKLAKSYPEDHSDLA